MESAAASSRKAKITDVHRQEAARLKALWVIAGRPDQTLLGEQYGIGSQSAVSNFLNGHSPLSMDAARGFARALACEVGAFSQRLSEKASRIAEVAPPATDDDFVDVRRVDVRLGAGDGSINGIDETVGSLKFARKFLRGIGVSPAGARVVDVHGPSMEPTIRDGAVLLVSTANKEPRNDSIFALARPGDGLIVKRLVKLGKDQWVARSDNREFQDIPIGPGEPITIIGRAHWMGVKI